MKNLEQLKHLNFLIHYCHYSPEILQSNSLLQSLSGHASYVDLHERSEEMIRNIRKSVTLAFSRILSYCNHESWQDVIPLRDLSEHTNLGDSHPRSRSLGRVEVSKSLSFTFFLNSVTTIVDQATPVWVTFSQGQDHKVP